MGFVKSFSRYRSGNDEEVWTQLFTGVPIIDTIRKIRYNGKTTVIRLILEVLRYACGQSDLTSVFTTREGLSIALQHSMSERTFKDWIKTAIFKKPDYGTYEKRYK